MASLRNLTFLSVGDYLEIVENSRPEWLLVPSRVPLPVDIDSAFELTDIDFKKEFRFPKHVVKAIIDELEPHSTRSQRKFAVGFDRKVLATLQFLACGSYHRVLGAKYNIAISQPMVSQSIATVCDLIIKHLMHRWIIFPKSASEVLAVKKGFFDKFNYPGVVGALDCTHVRIQSPKVYDPVYPAIIYLDRHNEYSINVEAVCDSELKILAINTRYPGSVHDSAIWQMSPTHSHLKRQYLNGDKSSRLMGDSGYPQQPWLFTPILNAPEQSKEEKYNVMHRSARNTIERCFGVLKQRFRCCLKHRVLHYHPVTAGKLVLTAAVLHNIAMHHNLTLDEPYVSDSESDDDSDVDDSVPAGEPNWRTLGQEARQHLIRRMFPE